jgi:toxin ParE1/3/4
VQIRLTESAAADLERIEAHIRADRPEAVVDTVLRVLEALDGLMLFPHLGRSGRVRGTRELVVSGTPFFAVYRVQTDGIWVLRVLHAARRWP